MFLKTKVNKGTAQAHTVPVQLVTLREQLTDEEFSLPVVRSRVDGNREVDVARHEELWHHARRPVAVEHLALHGRRVELAQDAVGDLEARPRQVDQRAAHHVAVLGREGQRVVHQVCAQGGRSQQSFIFFIPSLLLVEQRSEFIENVGTMYLI